MNLITCVRILAIMKLSDGLYLRATDRHSSTNVSSCLAEIRIYCTSLVVICVIIMNKYD